MRDTVDELLVTEVDPEQVKGAGTFDKLGNTLGALGFQIDMLGYQPVLARKLFVYDAEAGELKHVTGRVAHEEPELENAAADDDEDEDEEVVPEPKSAAEVAEGVTPKKANEFMCTGCFLLVNAGQFGPPGQRTCPVGEAVCPAIEKLEKGK